MADKPKTVAESGPEDGFLKRWSRQKRSAAELSAMDAEVPVVAETPRGDDPAPAIDPADLPDIESLTADSDFSVFMREGVPEELRRLALRKLWLSDPVLANLDGLNDYDEDFSLVGTVVEKVTTAYKAGRGYLEEGEGEDDDVDDVIDGDGDLGEPDAVAVEDRAADTEGAAESDPPGNPVKPTSAKT